MHATTLQQLTPVGGWLDAGRVRITPLNQHDVSFSSRQLLGLVKKIGRLDASHLFMTLTHNMSLFWCWLTLAQRLMPHGEIARRETELVILRVAWNCRSRYEWGQHVDISLGVGLTVDDIARVTLGADAPDLAPQIKLLMCACDELHHERMLSEHTWLGLEAYYGKRQLIEVIMLIGFYEMLASFLNSAGVPLESRIEQILQQSIVVSARIPPQCSVDKIEQLASLQVKAAVVVKQNETLR